MLCGQYRLCTSVLGSLAPVEARGCVGEEPASLLESFARWASVAGLRGSAQLAAMDTLLELLTTLSSGAPIRSIKLHGSISSTGGRSVLLSDVAEPVSWTLRVYSEEDLRAYIEERVYVEARDVSECLGYWRRLSGRVASAAWEGGRCTLWSVEETSIPRALALYREALRRCVEAGSCSGYTLTSILRVGRAGGVRVDADVGEDRVKLAYYRCMNDGCTEYCELSVSRGAGETLLFYYNTEAGIVALVRMEPVGGAYSMIEYSIERVPGPRGFEVVKEGRTLCSLV